MILTIMIIVSIHINYCLLIDNIIDVLNNPMD